MVIQYDIFGSARLGYAFCQVWLKEPVRSECYYYYFF